MYQSFYHLQSDPFRLAPDPRFSFRHRSYAAAMSHLQEALAQEEGFVAVTARPGTGKTTLTEEFIAGLDPARLAVGKLVTTQVDAAELLRLIAYAFEIEVEGQDPATVLRRLEEFFRDQRAHGRRALLIIDEAQGLSPEALEQLRQLSNLYDRDRSLLQLVLVGQEQLQALLTAPELEQLQQRIVATCRLQALTLEETRAYVHHRICVAGWQGDPGIDPAVFILVHRFSEGLPRYINRLCNRLLLHGTIAAKHQLGVEDAALVLLDLNEELLTPVHDQRGPEGSSNRELLYAAAAGEAWRGMLSQAELHFLDQARFEPPAQVAEAAEPPLLTTSPPPAGRAPRRWMRWAAAAAALAVITLYLVPHPDGPVEAIASPVQPDAAAKDLSAAAMAPMPAAVSSSAVTAKADTAALEPAQPDSPAPEDGRAAAALPRLPALAAVGPIELALASPRLENPPGPAAASAGDSRAAPTAVAPPATRTSEPKPEAGARTASVAKLDRLLASAREALAADRLTVPKGDNAYDYLRQAQRLEANNPQVTEGMDRIAQRYAVLARWWMQQRKYGKATQLINRGLRVRPHDPTLHALRQQMHTLALESQQPSPFPSAFDETPAEASAQTAPKTDQQPNFFDRLKALFRRGAGNDDL